jgi:hypothetical protein
MTKRHRQMRGGFLESLTQGATDAWEKAKKATTDAYSSATGSSVSPSTYVPPPPSTVPPTPSTGSYTGGKKRSRGRGRSRSRSRSRRMRGGYSDNVALTGLAASAAPISDIKSAQPLTTVGGRKTKRRRRHRHGKSCKNNRKY